MGFQDILIIPSTKKSDILQNVKNDLIMKLKNGDECLNIENTIALFEEGFFTKHGHFHEFLENSEIQFVVPSPEPRNSELEARIQKLKAQQENEEYKKMTKGLIYTKEERVSLREDVKQVTSQVTAVINFVFTVIGSFFFAYKAVEYALPENNIPAQVLMGIITASVVALADLYFLARTI